MLNEHTMCSHSIIQVFFFLTEQLECSQGCSHSDPGVWIHLLCPAPRKQKLGLWITLFGYRDA